GQPEILQADLAPLALQLAQWGVDDPTELRWLDRPPAAALQQGRELLEQLGALARTARGWQVTDHGSAIAALPLHPRLAHVVLRGQQPRLGGQACRLAAVPGDPAVLPGAGGAATVW